MKKFVQNCSLLFLLAACSMAIQAQGFKVENDKSPSLSDSSSSRSFASLDGKFSISLPETVSAFQPLSFKTLTGTATGQGFSWRTAEGQFSIMYMDRPEPLSDPNAVSLLLDQ